MLEGEFTKLSSSTIALICQLGYVFGFTIFSIQAFGTASLIAIGGFGPSYSHMRREEDSSKNME